MRYLILALLLTGCARQKPPQPISTGPKPHWIDADNNRKFSKYGHWECPAGWTTSLEDGKASCVADEDYNKEMEEFERSFKP